MKGSGLLEHWFSNVTGTVEFHGEKAMAPCSSTLAWKIPWTEEPSRLQSMGSKAIDFFLMFVMFPVS